MQPLRSPLFVVSCWLFAWHQWLQQGLGVHLRVADAWLDNLVAMPIILTLLVTERRVLFRHGPSYQLSATQVVLATLYVAVVSELLFPRLSPRFTFDWLDFVFYGLGAAGYWVVERPRLTSSAT